MGGVSHILILGGGIGGPALGIALAKKGIDSTIYELRGKSNEAQGGSISLAAPAIRVLDQTLGMLDHIKAVGYTYDHFSAFDDTGYKYGKVVTDDEGYKAVRIMRGELRRLLMEEYVRVGGEVVYEKRMTKAVESRDGVEVHFEDGTTAQGDFLIGADGIHSSVRRHILGTISPTPTYAGSSTVYYFLPRPAIDLPAHCTLPAIFFSRYGIIMLMPTDVEGENVTWGLTEETEDKGTKEGWRAYERSGEIAQVAKRNYGDCQTQPIKSLIDSLEHSDLGANGGGRDGADGKRSKGSTEARIWGHYEIPDIPTWHRGRACLLGDAAHSLPPNGLGISMALEDAALLARVLASDSMPTEYDKAFSTFEAKRRVRLDEIRRISKVGRAIRGRSNPVVWWIKSWVFWAYFWWKGGLMQGPGGGSKYDAETEDIGA